MTSPLLLERCAVGASSTPEALYQRPPFSDHDTLVPDGRARRPAAGARRRVSAGPWQIRGARRVLTRGRGSRHSGGKHAADGWWWTHRPPSRAPAPRVARERDVESGQDCRSGVRQVAAGGPRSSSRPRGASLEPRLRGRGALIIDQGSPRQAAGARRRWPESPEHCRSPLEACGQQVRVPRGWADLRWSRLSVAPAASGFERRRARLFVAAEARAAAWSPTKAAGPAGGRRTVRPQPVREAWSTGNSLDSRLGATPRQTGRHRTAGSVSARVTALTVGSVSRRGE